MVSAKEDVQDTQHDIAAHHAPSGLIGGEFDPRLLGVDDGGPLAAAERLDADDVVGDGEL